MRNTVVQRIQSFAAALFKTATRIHATPAATRTHRARLRRGAALSLAVSLPLAASLLPGCAGLNDSRYEFGQKIRTSQAWYEFEHCQNECLTCDYRSGWKAGYYDVVTGGDGCPPPIAPKKYWKPPVFFQHDPSRRDDWYCGWQDGAACAKTQPDHHHLKLWMPPAPACHLTGHVVAVPSVPEAGSMTEPAVPATNNPASETAPEARGETAPAANTTQPDSAATPDAAKTITPMSGTGSDNRGTPAGDLNVNPLPPARPYEDPPEDGTPEKTPPQPELPQSPATGTPANEVPATGTPATSEFTPSWLDPVGSSESADSREDAGATEFRDPNENLPRVPDFSAPSGPAIPTRIPAVPADSQPAPSGVSESEAASPETLAYPDGLASVDSAATSYLNRFRELNARPAQTRPGHANTTPPGPWLAPLGSSESGPSSRNGGASDSNVDSATSPYLSRFREQNVRPTPTESGHTNADHANTSAADASHANATPRGNFLQRLFMNSARAAQSRDLPGPVSSVDHEPLIPPRPGESSLPKLPPIRVRMGQTNSVVTKTGRVE